jgi:hypothetical protein
VRALAVGWCGVLLFGLFGNLYLALTALKGRLIDGLVLLALATGCVVVLWCMARRSAYL